MNWMDQVGGLLEQYGAGTAPAKEAEGHFDQVAQVAPRSALAEGLAAAFGSSQTPAPASMVSQLFGQSNSQQQAGLINTLIASVGPAVAAQLLTNGGASSLASLLGSGKTELTPEQAAQISPQTIEQIAAHAEKEDPSLLNKLGAFYSEHPTLVKSLGAVALGVVMSKLANR